MWHGDRQWLIRTQWIFLGVVLLILLGQAYHPLWRSHLQVDVVTYQLRAMHFEQHGSWAGMAYNEYQPGALWYFVLLGWLTSAPEQFDAFLTTTVLANLALITAHFYFFKRHGHPYAPYFFLFILLATGPILFFRFELLVSLIVLWSWYYFAQKKWSTSAWLLGLAVAIKLYPVVLLPLLVAEAIRNKNWRKFVPAVAWFMFGLLGPVMLLLLFGASLDSIKAGIDFHNLKPVGPEGIWGSTITLLQSWLDIPLRITPGYGVHGLTSDLPFLSNDLLNQAWLFPYGVVLIAIIWLSRRPGYTDPGFAFFLLFIFVLFAKVLNPQYVWWYMVFLPLISWYWYQRTSWMIVLLTVGASLVLTQWVYPLHYSEFLNWLNGKDSSPTLFYVSVLRNVLLVLLFGLSVFGFWRSWLINQKKSPLAVANSPKTSLR